MEIIDPNHRQELRDNTLSRCRMLYAGIILIATGLLWMLHNLDLLGGRMSEILFSWQMLLIVAGGYLLLLKRWVAGSAALLLGVLFGLTDLFRIDIPVGEVLLPLLVMAIGVAVLVQYRH